MKKLKKVGLILAGYVLAFACACLAVYLNELRTRIFQDPSGGMMAAGDLFLFIGVFAFVSIFPTGLALYYLRSHEGFWDLFSLFAVGLALTGPVAEVYNHMLRVSPVDAQSWWALLSVIPVLRVIGLFVLGFGDILFAFITPFPRPRIRLLIAAGIEAALFLYVAVHLLFWHNLA